MSLLNHCLVSKRIRDGYMLSYWQRSTELLSIFLGLPGFPILLYSDIMTHTRMEDEFCPHTGACCIECWLSLPSLHIHWASFWNLGYGLHYNPCFIIPWRSIHMSWRQWTISIHLLSSFIEEWSLIHYLRSYSKYLRSCTKFFSNGLNIQNLIAYCSWSCPVCQPIGNLIGRSSDVVEVDCFKISHPSFIYSILFCNSH